VTPYSPAYWIHARLQSVMYDLEGGGSRSQHQLNHSCVILKLRWRFQSANLKYNFRSKVLFFNLALKVKLKVTLNQIFRRRLIIQVKTAHGRRSFAPLNTKTLCLNMEVKVLETLICSCYEYLRQSFITRTHTTPPYLLR
jgi:hypothetical protein